MRPKPESPRSPHRNRELMLIVLSRILTKIYFKSLGLTCYLKMKRIRFFNNFNFFKSQETVNVLVLDFSGINYPFASKFSSKTFETR